MPARADSPATAQTPKSRSRFRSRLRLFGSTPRHCQSVRSAERL